MGKEIYGSAFIMDVKCPKCNKWFRIHTDMNDLPCYMQCTSCKNDFEEGEVEEHTPIAELVFNMDTFEIGSIKESEKKRVKLKSPHTEDFMEVNDFVTRKVTPDYLQNFFDELIEEVKEKQGLSKNRCWNYQRYLLQQP